MTAWDAGRKSGSGWARVRFLEAQIEDAGMAYPCDAEEVRRLSAAYHEALEAVGITPKEKKP